MATRDMNREFPDELKDICELNAKIERWACGEIYLGLDPEDDEATLINYLDQIEDGIEIARYLQAAAERLIVQLKHKKSEIGS